VVVKRALSAKKPGVTRRFNMKVSKLGASRRIVRPPLYLAP